MSRRLPPLNALRAFEAAARHNSFSGAAEELHVSHAAISRHVRSLEARIGATLFRRARRGVDLTETGRDYLAAIGRAFDDIAAATDRLGRAAGVQICISAEPAFASRWLVPRLGGFRERQPDFDVFLDPSPMLADLHRDEADLAIRYGRGGWPNLRHDLIAATRLVPIASPALAASLGAATRPAELARCTLLHEDGGGLWRRWFAAVGLPAVDVTRGPRLFETTLAIDAAIAGQGVALGYDLLIVDELASGRLVRLSDVALADGSYYLLSLDGALRRKPLAAFRDWLLAETAPLRAV